MNKALLEKVKPTVNLSSWYFCPHCQKRLFKGRIKTLKMVCPNCNRLIDSNGEPLLNSTLISSS